MTDDCTYGVFEEHDFPFYTSWNLSGGKIRICTWSTMTWSTLYSRIWEESTDGVDKWCGVLDLAATLLHELVHAIGLAGSDEPGECESSYLIETAFRFVLFRRYPTIANSTCCNNFMVGAADVLVGHDGVIYASKNCLSSSGGSSGGSSSGWSTEEWIYTKSHTEAPIT